MGAPERRGLRVFCHAAANVMVSSQQDKKWVPGLGPVAENGGIADDH
jgi:hypothetical protein